VRREAALALSGFAADSQAARAALNRALRDDDAAVRLAAAMAIARLERNAAEGKDPALPPAGARAVNLGWAALVQVTRRGGGPVRALPRPLLVRAMADPLLQGRFDAVVMTYIAIKLPRLPHGLDEQADQLLDLLQSEAIPALIRPALIRGLNLVAAYGLGFC
jgi:hypothetical protein